MGKGAASVKPVSRKRKETYIVRKEEKQALETQILELELQSARLRAHVVQQPRFNVQSPFPGDVKAHRRALEAVAHHNERVVARAQSLVSDCLRVQSRHPLDTPIHLGAEWEGRQQYLRAMKRAKLSTAYKYILERTRGLHASNPGLLTPHHSEERYETDDGKFCCDSFEIIQFFGVKSVKQVYEAALAFFQSMEISISEKLGHLTVRDDCYDDTVTGSVTTMTKGSLDDKVSHYRLVSSEVPGLKTEMNLVGFCQYFDDIADVLGANDEEMSTCGFFTSDCVNSDAIYPYNPSERIRRDVTAAIAITPREIVNARGEKELVVIMRRAAYLKIHPAQIPVAREAEDALRAGINAWGDIMVKVMRGMIYAPPDPCQ